MWLNIMYFRWKIDNKLSFYFGFIFVDKYIDENVKIYENDKFIFVTSKIQVKLLVNLLLQK